LTTLREAFLEGLTKPQSFREHSGKSRLYISELGKCPRRAMLRVLGYKPSIPFSPTLLEAMSIGNAMEGDTFKVLERAYPGLLPQLVLGNDIWSGRADFFLPGQPAMIIEHKYQGEKYWDYQGKLPQHDHVAQAWAYGELYKEQNHKPVIVMLLYRAWGHWAEMEITTDEDGDVVTCEGQVDGEKRVRSWEAGFGQMRLEYERLYQAQELPDVPSGLLQESTGCTFQNRPSCGYHDLCWGK
jgi:hypothetical protein